MIGGTVAPVSIVTCGGPVGLISHGVGKSLLTQSVLPFKHFQSGKANKKLESGQPIRCRDVT